MNRISPFRERDSSGLFRWTEPTATPGDGAFKIDSNGQVVTSNGNKLLPEVILPEGFIRDSLAISQDGRINVKLPGSDDPVQVGQLQLFRFVNPAGLQAIGENTFKISNASGDPIRRNPRF